MAPIIGVRPGDITSALAGSPGALRRVHFAFYVWPHIQKWLEELKLIHPPPLPDIGPIPRPDPPPFLLEELAPAILAPLLGDPDPAPNLVAARVETLQVLRDGLASLEKTLDTQIATAKKNAG